MSNAEISGKYLRSRSTIRNAWDFRREVEIERLDQCQYLSNVSPDNKLGLIFGSGEGKGRSCLGTDIDQKIHLLMYVF